MTKLSNPSTELAEVAGQDSSLLSESKPKIAEQPAPVESTTKSLGFLTPEQYKDNDRYWAQQNDRQAAEDAKRFWTESRAPALHSSLSRETIARSPEAWREAHTKILARVGKGGFVSAIIGPRGRGKTQLAVEAMRKSCHSGRSAIYFRTYDLFSEVKHTFGGRGRSEADVLSRFIGYKLLVLDELRIRADSEFEGPFMAHLIDHRYSEIGRDTILICNLKRAEFDKEVGYSIVSRIEETGEVIECTWPSFRRTT